LVETNKDGQEGYQQAAEGVTRSDVKTLFYELGQQRAKFAGELQALVRELGGDPETTSSTVGALHRSWINIKSLVTGKDEAAILSEAERGEDSAVNSYKKALEENLPANVQTVVQAQATEVKVAYDKVKSMLESANAATT